MGLHWRITTHSSCQQPSRVPDAGGSAYAPKQLPPTLPIIVEASTKYAPKRKHSIHLRKNNAALTVAILLSCATFLCSYFPTRRRRFLWEDNRLFLWLHSTTAQRRGHAPRIVHIFNATQTVRLGENKPAELRISRIVPSAYHQETVGEQDSEDYEDFHEYLEENDESQDCQLLFEWQLSMNPSCNIIHEADLSSLTWETDLSSVRDRRRIEYLSHGSYRDVLSVGNEIGEVYVFKPMRYEQGFSFRNIDRMRRESAVLDRMTGAKYILNSYGACGTSATFEYASGDMNDFIWPVDDDTDGLDPIHKLHFATQAAMALASLHNIDREGRSTIAHTDIKASQYLYVDGVFKLNDFNRARFLRYSKTSHAVCPFRVGKNAGNNRSPEEYAYEDETEKVDVFSLGNIFYSLLQEEDPFEFEDSVNASRMVLEGIRPTVIERDGWNSSVPVFAALQEAMHICHRHDPIKRATAREVESLLKQSMEQIDPGRLLEWGDI